jgi:hypothetical protein
VLYRAFVTDQEYQQRLNGRAPRSSGGEIHPLRIRSAAHSKVAKNVSRDSGASSAEYAIEGRPATLSRSICTLGIWFNLSISCRLRSSSANPHASIHQAGPCRDRVGPLRLNGVLPGPNDLRLQRVRAGDSPTRHLSVQYRRSRRCIGALEQFHTSRCRRW